MATTDRLHTQPIPVVASETAAVTPAPSTPPAGSRVPARVRILGWLLLMMSVMLASIGAATGVVLLADVDRRAQSGLVQEIEEFNTFARVGVDPTSGAPFASVVDLLDVHLARQYPNADELLIGWSEADNGRPVRYSPRDPPYDVVGDPAAMGILRQQDQSGFGVLTTPAGDAHFAIQYVEGPAGERGAFVVLAFTDRERAEVTGRLVTMAWIGLAALVLTGGIGWFVAGQILAPVRLVRRTAARITAEDLSERIPVYGRDDIAALAEQFNAMLDRLEQTFATQRQFLDDASHELRTPITIVSGHLELMSDDPAERAATVRLVSDELLRMGRIVEDLLVLAKSEQPDFVRREPIQVAELTSDIAAKAGALGTRRWNLEHVGDGVAHLDPQRVTQAMVQLVQNAVAFTGDDDSIRLGSTLGPGTPDDPLSPYGLIATFWVTDSGPGVDPEELEVIFERFARGTTVRSDGSGPAARAGAGLGLAIVRAIADAHAGRVWVESVPGRGATFRLVLPADPPDLSAGEGR